MKTITSFLLATLLVGYSARAQFPEDALRLSYPGLSVGARALGLGTAYTSIANDFSAVYWNPAGLGQLRLSEVSFGLSHLSYRNTSTFLGNQQSFTNSATNLNNFGLVYPVPTMRGSFVVAVGYGRQTEFTTGLSFRGFNGQNSIIPILPLTEFDLAYELYLVDSVGATPIRDSLQQEGKVLEGGGINYWTVSGAVEAAKNLFFGATLNFISGSYRYNRDYTETDILNKYDSADVRFGVDYALTSFNVINTVDGDISGFTAKLGMLYKSPRGVRFGLAVKIPTYYTIRENFSSDGLSEFDVPDRDGYTSYNYRIERRTEYDVRSPFVFSGGVSVPLGDLLIAGDAEYIDYTQMEFSNADPTLERYNTNIKEIFRPVLNIRTGLEYIIPTADVRIRGGFAWLPSPYDGDPSSFDQKFITGGLGFIVENSVAIDLGYAYGFWETFRVNYDGSPRTNEKVKTHNVIGTLSYRF